MDQKSFFASTINWAAIIGVLGAVLPAFGLNLAVGVEQDVATAVGATTAAGAAIWVLVERYRKGDLYIRKPKA